MGEQVPRSFLKAALMLVFPIVPPHPMLSGDGGSSDGSTSGGDEGLGGST